MPHDGCASLDGVSSSSHAVIHLHGASNFLLQSVGIAGAGQSALYIEEGCSGITVENCDLHDIGFGGVRVGSVPGGNGTTSAGLTSHINIVNCSIGNGGAVVGVDAAIVWQAGAQGIQAAGISVGDGFRYGGLWLQDI